MPQVPGQASFGRLPTESNSTQDVVQRQLNGGAVAYGRAKVVNTNIQALDTVTMVYTPAGVQKVIGLIIREGLPTNLTWINWNLKAFNSALGGFVFPGNVNVPGSAGIGAAEFQPLGDWGTATASDSTSITDAGKNFKSPGATQYVGGQVRMGGKTLVITSQPSNTKLTGSAGWKDDTGTLASSPTTGAYVLAGPLDGSALDAGIATVRDYNANGGDIVHPTNGVAPTHKWTGKLRISSGEQVAAWMKGVGGAAVSTVGAQSGGTVSVGRWWTPEYLEAWKNLMNALAWYVPAGETSPLRTNPLCGEVTEAIAMTLFAESFQKDDYRSASAGAASLIAVGYTWNLDKAAHQNADAWLNSSSVWGNCPFSLAHTPALNIYHSTDPSVPDPDDAFTSLMVDTIASYAKGVNENNSLGADQLAYPPAGGGNPAAYHDRSVHYTAMYTRMAKWGKGQAKIDLGFGSGVPSTGYYTPICIQTSTLDRMKTGTLCTPADVLASLDYAIWLGARCIEMPSGFDGGSKITTGVTLSQLLPYWSQLIANSP